VSQTGRQPRAEDVQADALLGSGPGAVRDVIRVAILRRHDMRKPEVVHEGPVYGKHECASK